MFTKRSISLTATGMILLVVSLISLCQPSPVLAQCGDSGEQLSSCIKCHETQAPVADKGEWHIIHASKDICLNCHGGNGSIMDQGLAHMNMTVDPLEDVYTDCHACHPDYDSRAERFAITLGVTPGSCATPTTVAAGGVSGGSSDGNLVIPSNTNMVSMPATPSQVVPIVISGGMLALALLLFALSRRTNHTLRH